jgi:hypothetical protein
VFLDPGRPPTPGQRGIGARPHRSFRRWARCEKLISGVDSTAFALAAYASSSGSPRPTQDSLLAAGQLYQVGLVTHRAPLKGFRPRFLLSQPIRTQERQGSVAGPAAMTFKLLGRNASPVNWIRWSGLG